MSDFDFHFLSNEYSHEEITPNNAYPNAKGGFTYQKDNFPQIDEGSTFGDSIRKFEHKISGDEEFLGSGGFEPINWMKSPVNADYQLDDILFRHDSFPDYLLGEQSREDFEHKKHQEVENQVDNQPNYSMKIDHLTSFSPEIQIESLLHKRKRKTVQTQSTTSKAPNKNVLKNHEKSSFCLLNYKKYAKCPLKQKVIPAIARECDVTIRSLEKCLGQLNLMKIPNFQTLPNIWTSDELKIVPEDYDSDTFDVNFFEEVDKVKMAKAVQMFKKIYFKRYVPLRAYNGRAREAMDAMIGTAQHLLRCLNRRTAFSKHISLLSKDQ